MRNTVSEKIAECWIPSKKTAIKANCLSFQGIFINLYAGS